MSAPIDAAMVLAAGRGTRMLPLTKDRPKPLLAAGGRTLLDRTLDRLEEVGVRRAVVNIHHHAGQMETHLKTRRTPALRISDERDELLETGGGVKQALPLIDAETFLLANSDNIWIGPRALQPLLDAWRPAEMDVLLLLVPIETAHGYSRAGDFFLGTDGRLSWRGDQSRAPFVYSGAAIYAARVFDQAPAGAYSLLNIWEGLIRAGRVFGAVHRRGWIDVGTPAGLSLADGLVSAWPRPAAAAR